MGTSCLGSCGPTDVSLGGEVGHEVVFMFVSSNASQPYEKYCQGEQGAPLNSYHTKTSESRGWMKEEGDRRDFYNRLLFFTLVSRGSHIRDNGQDTRTVSALRRQKEKATHWPALCHKLNMKTNNKERSDSPAPRGIA
ncbi:hypothetical protein ElyMa_006206000 [Elysia marginata]|uniref:Uncharacterized protein n=1 Tax=Elysia marginata TaxID=1093978 RepID=A0AAV4H4R2_9GAST|nr:hypothetical protein ElyMa_006206000 [Elysia marginata]